MENQTDQVDKLPEYQRHAGTITISHATSPIRAGLCAAHHFKNKKFPIEFLSIGVGANHQATKSMGHFRKLVLEAYENIDVGFQPLRFATETLDDNTGEHKLKDCTVWRAVFFATQNQNDISGKQSTVHLRLGEPT